MEIATALAVLFIGYLLKVFVADKLSHVAALLQSASERRTEEFEQTKAQLLEVRAILVAIGRELQR